MHRFRYYEYLSAAKVDALFSQIANAEPRMAKDVSINLALINGAIRLDSAAEQSTYEKLRAVEDWIYAHEPVGSIDEPDKWILAHAPLYVSYVDPYAAREPEQLPITANRAAVVFATQTAQGNGLVMAGSARHLAFIGQNTRNETMARMDIGWSNLIYIRHLLKHYAAPVELLPNAHSPLDQVAPIDHRQYGAWALWEGVEGVLDHFAESPANRLELGGCQFIAKRLGPPQTRNGVTNTLATPLFVGRDD